ncbi:putative diguanylate cyclase YcdT [Tepidimonas fonticaldi]|uniref:diguanylate cyclase n=1 Tax=Tepidimonas fonticaldi TaxID=1101373 RepID=A0A554XMC9_9BURK|nr:diguanylate cyclase [Tepidimonas fonticaldi]TSE36982.1 putative diguanylate cyclase YcdT [Tepidimonas fonticaldi]
MIADPRARVRLAQLHLYVDVHRHDRYVAPVLAIITALLLSHWVPTPWALGWLVLELLIIAHYLWVYRRFKRADPPPSEERRWANRIALAHGAHMLAWSSLVVWAWQPGDFGNLMFVMLVHVGLISLTVSMSNAHLRLLWLDMTFPVLALIAPPLLEPSAFHLGLSLLGIGFCALMVLVGRQINAATTEAIELRQRNEQLIQELHSQATRDALTGLINRRYLLETGARLLQQRHRSGEPLALLIIDLDHFKRINDQHGHLGGDEVLVAVVGTCAQHVRAGDCFGRLGGEEFALVLPDTQLAQARDLAERLRSATAALAIPLPGVTIRPTISVGLAMATDDDTTLSDLLRRADAAMYEAKAGGRNRVVCVDPAGGFRADPVPA